MNLLQKINEVQKKVKTVVKDAEIAQGNNSYSVVTHDAVTKALHMPMAEAGIVAWPTITECKLDQFTKTTTYQNQTKETIYYRADIKVKVTFINSEDTNDKLETEFISYAMDTSDKAVGKAYSMAIKNIYLKVFMLESLDQEEARVLEEQSRYVQKQQQQRPPVKNYAPQSASEAKQKSNEIPF